MTALMLIGAVPCEAAPMTAEEDHLYLPVSSLAGLAVEVSLDDNEDDATRTLNWANLQNRVLIQYIQNTDVLPINLGAVFSNSQVLSDHLLDKTPALMSAFNPLKDRCEYILQLGVKARAAHPSAPPKVASGAAFLRSRQSDQEKRKNGVRDRRQFVQILDTALAQWSEARRTRETPRNDLYWDLSLLVHRKTTDELIEGLTSWADRANALDLSLRLIGPLPAYSFAENVS